jgi:hypothetical protein
MVNFNENLIAPCGMNCGVCLHYLRASNKCTGCLSGRKVNAKPIKCAIKLCKSRNGEYCFNCAQFPCERLKRLDKRYREKYEMSEIENLEDIKKNGLDYFLNLEETRWIDPDGIYCVHDKKRYPQES